MPAKQRRTGAAKAASGKSGKRTAHAQQLQGMIQELIAATQRGDEPQRKAIATALAEFHGRPIAPELKQAAAEASVVATNQAIGDNVRLLGQIAARL